MEGGASEYICGGGRSKGFFLTEKISKTIFSEYICGGGRSKGGVFKGKVSKTIFSYTIREVIALVYYCELVLLNAF